MATAVSTILPQGQNQDGQVIDELLCFLTNKLNYVNTSTIVQLCVSFYDDEKVVSSKNRLFELCADNESDRNRKRVGPNKKSDNIKDMIKLLQEKGTEIPTFVAQDLSMLPPITFDNLDVTVLLNQIKKNEIEVKMLKECVTIQQDNIGNLINTIEKVGSRVFRLENVIDKRETTRQGNGQQGNVQTGKHTDGGISNSNGEVPTQEKDMTGKSHEADSANQNMLPAEDLCVKSAENQTTLPAEDEKNASLPNPKTYKEAVAAASMDQTSASASMSDSPGAVAFPEKESRPTVLPAGQICTSVTQTNDIPSTATGAVNKNPNEWSNVTRINGKLRAIPENEQVRHRTYSQQEENNVPKAEQIQARNTRRQGFGIKGRSKDTGIDTVKRLTKPRIAKIFATGFKPGLLADSLKAYLYDRLKLVMDVEQTKTRFNTYASFRINCECPNPEVFMDADLWPENASVYWWREARTSPREGSTMSTTPSS